MSNSKSPVDTIEDLEALSGKSIPLPGSPRVRVQVWTYQERSEFGVRYSGPTAELLKVRAVTKGMLTPNPTRARRVDANGDGFMLKRVSRARGDHITVIRYKPICIAHLLPGVADLLPKALELEARCRARQLAQVEAEGADPEREEPPADNVRHWTRQEREQLSQGMSAMFAALQSLACPSPTSRFRWAAGEVERVKQFLNETEARFAVLLGSLRGDDRRRAGLRLVVDNTP